MALQVGRTSGGVKSIAERSYGFTGSANPRLKSTESGSC